MSLPEAEHREHKRSLNEWREVVETVAAFATASGGTIHIGITPDGHRAGIQIGNQTLEGLAGQIRQNTDPPQYPSIVVDGPDHASVIQVRVEEAPIKPVTAFGLPYKTLSQ